MCQKTSSNHLHHPLLQKIATCMCYDQDLVNDTPKMYALAPKLNPHRGGSPSLGYLTLHLGNLGMKNTSIKELAHRLVLFSIHGPPPDEDTREAMHTCHNPGCLNPHHLVWGSSKDNKLKGAAAQARYLELKHAQGRG